MPLIPRPNLKRNDRDSDEPDSQSDAAPSTEASADAPQSPLEAPSAPASASPQASSGEPPAASEPVAPESREERQQAGTSARPEHSAKPEHGAKPENGAPGNGASSQPQPAGQRPPAASGATGGITSTAASASADLRQRLHRTLIREIDQSALSSMPADEARAFVEQAVRQLIDREVPAGRAGFRDRLLQQLVDDVLGLGPLEPLLRDQSISEIMVNGAQQVYVERSGKLHLADVHFQDDAHVVHVIERIIAMTGRTIDESSPLVDARLEDGSRVHAVIAPASISGPLLTIRKFVADRLTADDLVELGSLSSGARDILAACVHAGLNIIVSGGTGSGKTTMLNVLSSWIPSDGAHRHDRRPGRAVAAPATRGAAGGAPGRPRGRRERDRAARPAEERAAHATGPHHRR